MRNDLQSPLYFARRDRDCVAEVRTEAADYIEEYPNATASDVLALIDTLVAGASEHVAFLEASIEKAVCANCNAPIQCLPGAAWSHLDELTSITCYGGSFTDESGYNQTQEDLEGHT